MSSNEGAAAPKHGFKIAGTVFGVLLFLAGLIVAFGPNTPELPIYGFGTMLFVAFVGCVWLACVLGLREGIPPTTIQDMAIWIFVFGIIGARLTFMFLAAPERFDGFPIIIFQFVKVWDGGTGRLPQGPRASGHDASVPLRE